MLRSFARDEGGAISSLYAVGILVLVAMAGIGFDYGRLMTLNSELQNAADQAALAAATQLDGRDDAMTRARSAATNAFATATSSYVNQTRIANDGSGRPITNLTFQFYDSYSSGGDTLGTELTDDTKGAQAQVVQVTVNARKVFYALTPLIGAFNSGNVIGKATAALDSALCKVPPLMVCAPSVDFPTASDIGKGVLMEPGASVGFWRPGTFGYLDLLGGGANGLRQLLGSNGLQNTCISNDGTVDAKPGNTASAPDALNTRFDMYAGGLNCGSDGTFCPVQNTRKDQVRSEAYTYKNPGAVPARPACDSTLPSGHTNGKGGAPDTDVGSWQTVPSGLSPASAAMQGFPRDTCHDTYSCGGNFGDGVWNRSAYLAAMPFGASVPADKLTRYQVYQWELDNPTQALNPILVNSGDAVG
ncbi:TadE/TadG family type IV pilus assembly protein, partial [Novosphingobium sp.]|uniref:TadE/TadG family type IV pilus assembly protein n=1 Tax=Novosphingobium sp. TaxID=1874826 RepID=UPI002B470EB8